MDAWTSDQLALMKQGGGERLRQCLIDSSQLNCHSLTLLGLSPVYHRAARNIPKAEVSRTSCGAIPPGSLRACNVKQCVV
jgi:hypothetical protein